MTSVSAVNQKELAERLGLTTRQIRNLEKSGLPKESKKGKASYPWPATMHWYIEYRIKLAEPKDLAEAEKRKAIAEAQLAELKLQREEGKLLPVDEAEKQVEDLLSGLRAQLLTFPQRVAPTLVTCKSVVEIQTALDDAMNQTLTVLSAE